MLNFRLEHHTYQTNSLEVKNEIITKQFSVYLVFMKLQEIIIDGDASFEPLT